jgi:serine/threonine protein kinase
MCCATEKRRGGAMQDDQLFMAEIGVMSKLAHPYIAKYLGCGMLAEEPGKQSSQNAQHHIAIVRMYRSKKDP